MATERGASARWRGVEVSDGPLCTSTYERPARQVRRRLRRVEHLAHPGASTLYVVEVAEGPAVLGVDPELACDCPRLVGLTWIDAPTLERWEGDDVRSLLLVRLC